MTVICVPPTPTVRHGISTAKPLAHTVLPQKRKVRFSERVRVRRRTQTPLTKEEFHATWFTAEELYDRRRKDKKLRYAIARQPEAFSTEQMLVLGLYTEDERRQRNKRALHAQAFVLSQQQSMDVDTGSESDDSSTFTTSTYSSYAFQCEAAASEAHLRAVQHTTHVQTIDNEDAASEPDMSQELVVSPEAALPKLPTIKIPKMNPPQNQLGIWAVCA
ncbi:unnamed protein product [Cylindrotheca closterium]|uniref:Uncharacterized protein n=1 Tax=Cylindrotheca closterium TaxID=2856 RepID=A0AAD2CKX3_9STRA|nr:unnamed protein product [Cylindrotheca closterium]